MVSSRAVPTDVFPHYCNASHELRDTCHRQRARPAKVLPLVGTILAFTQKFRAIPLLGDSGALSDAPCEGRKVEGANDESCTRWDGPLRRKPAGPHGL